MSPSSSDSPQRSIARKARRLVGDAALPARAHCTAAPSAARWFEVTGAMRKFYGQFVRTGDLVFDVGAAVGESAAHGLKQAIEIACWQVLSPGFAEERGQTHRP